MLEVLISLVVLSVGLLGLASLQVTGLKNIHESTQRAHAILLAHNLSDRIRSNTDGNYDMASGAVAGSLCTVGCNNAARAASDLAEWATAIAFLLPAGKGVVCIDSAPAEGDTFATPNCDGSGLEYSIKIWWDKNRDGNLDRPLLVSFRP